MEPIVSGTTKERIIRTTLLLLLFGGFAVMFLLDGYGGYARDNVKQFVRGNSVPVEELPPVNPTITSDRIRELEPQLTRASHETVRELLGDQPLEYEGAEYYFGPGTYVMVEYVAGQVAKVTVLDGQHSETDIRYQKLLGWLLTAIALILLIQFVRVITTRVELSDEGLKVRRVPRIPFEAMKGIRADEYMKTGWVELDYEFSGTPGSIRLDNYVIREFRPIINKICERCGFTNPLPAPEGADDTQVGENPNVALGDRRESSGQGKEKE